MARRGPVPRVVMDASAWCGSRGLGRYAAQMAAALAATGEVAVVPCSHSATWGPWTIPDDLAAQAVVWPASRLPWHGLRMPLLAGWLRPDAVWFPANEAAHWGCRPYLLTLHDVAQAHFPERFFAGSGEYQRFTRRLQRSVERAARIVTDAEFTKRDIVALTGCAPEHIAVVPLGVDPVFQPLDPQEAAVGAAGVGVEGPYILYVGGFDFRKNLERLLEAYRLVVESGREETLVLAGSGGQGGAFYPDLRAAAAMQGISDRVVFLEGVVRDDGTLRSLYNAASLFVFPSLFEGFGLPPLEAMACGTPVVCSSAASLSEVVGEAALTHGPEDTAALAKNMLRALEDGELRSCLRRAGLQRAARYTWAAAADAFLEKALRPVLGP